MYNDYIIRGTAADGQVRFFAATTRNLVEHARQIHNLSPVAAAALGRTLTAGAMMGAMLKGDDDLLTINIRGDGPINGITVTADSMARVKGFVGEPDVMLPASYEDRNSCGVSNEVAQSRDGLPAAKRQGCEGKLDVGGAVGHDGLVQVIRDTGLKDPYIGETRLISGEIAEDLTAYFAISEQVPSAVALGVLMNKDNTVRQAGGFIIQLLPGASDEVISTLEQKLTEVTHITELLDEGMTPEEFAEYIMASMNPEIMDTLSTEYYCNCSRERVSKAVMSVGAEDLKSMIDDGKEIEVNCHFCGKKYVFSVDDLKEMLKNK